MVLIGLTCKAYPAAFAADSLCVARAAAPPPAQSGGGGMLSGLGGMMAQGVQRISHSQKCIACSHWQYS